MKTIAVALVSAALALTGCAEKPGKKKPDDKEAKGDKMGDKGDKGDKKKKEEKNE